jgi:nucleoid-associated protein YgaU
VAAPGRGLRASVAALVALGILAGGAGGYWIDRELRPHPDRETVLELRRRLQAEGSQLHRLRGDLDRARSDLAAEQEHLRSAAADLEATRRALAEARRKLAEARQAETVRYRIRPGDTLWGLARTFLGDGRRWPEIVRANPSRITDPDRLLIGQVIDIRLGSGR